MENTTKARTLTETESAAIVNALHVAKEQYRKDAMACASNERTYKAFQLQADQAEKLAEEIDGYLLCLAY